MKNLIVLISMCSVQIFAQAASGGNEIVKSVYDYKSGKATVTVTCTVDKNGYGVSRENSIFGQPSIYGARGSSDDVGVFKHVKKISPAHGIKSSITKSNVDQIFKVSQITVGKILLAESITFSKNSKLAKVMNVNDKDLGIEIILSALEGYCGPLR